MISNKICSHFLSLYCIDIGIATNRKDNMTLGTILYVKEEAKKSTCWSAECAYAVPIGGAPNRNMWYPMIAIEETMVNSLP